MAAAYRTRADSSTERLGAHGKAWRLACASLCDRLLLIQPLAHSDCERTADACVRLLFPRLTCEDINVCPRTSDMSYAETRLVPSLFLLTICAPLKPNHPLLSPGPGSHQRRICLSDAPPVPSFSFFSLFPYSSHS